MSESPAPTAPATPPPANPNRLYQAAAWVVIVAGTVFVGAVIFCAGAYLSDGGWHGQHHGPCMMHHGQPPMPSDFGPGSPDFRPAGPGNGPGGPAGPPPSAPHR